MRPLTLTLTAAIDEVYVVTNYEWIWYNFLAGKVVEVEMEDAMARTWKEI